MSLLLSDKIYAQKSRIFLRPLIEVRNDKHIRPINTFIRNEQFTERDFRLIIPFTREDSSEFFYYEKELVDSPYFDTENYYETDKYLIYVFNLEKYKLDYQRFLDGEYTELSNRVKSLINIYWASYPGGKFRPHERVEAYLNPTIQTYEKYAHELDVPVRTLIKVKQLLDPPDIEKETFNSGIRLSKTRSSSGDSHESSQL